MTSSTTLWARARWPRSCRTSTRSGDSSATAPVPSATAFSSTRRSPCGRCAATPTGTGRIKTRRAWKGQGAALLQVRATPWCQVRVSTPFEDSTRRTPIGSRREWPPLAAARPSGRTLPEAAAPVLGAPRHRLPPLSMSPPPRPHLRRHRHRLQHRHRCRPSRPRCCRLARAAWARRSSGLACASATPWVVLGPA